MRSVASASTAKVGPDAQGKRRTSELFDGQATSYGSSFKTNYERAMFAIESKWILDRISGFRGTVLDIGTGRGRYARLLPFDDGKVQKVVGVDLSRQMLGSAARALAPERFRAIHADGARLPLRAASIDAVMAIRSVKYNADWKAMVSEASRVLRPGGTLVLYDMGQQTSVQTIVNRIQPPNRARPEVLPLNELVSCLNSSGFQIEEVKTFRVLPHIFYRPLERLPRIQRTLMDLEFLWEHTRRPLRWMDNFLVTARRR